MRNIRNVEQLEVWQEAHKLVLMVYQVTKNYPIEEQFSLVSQMRRAAKSITDNIDNGFKRPKIKEKNRFYNISEGSLEELKYFFILSKDLRYISSNDDLMTQSDLVGRLLYDFIISTNAADEPFTRVGSQKYGKNF